MKFDGLEWLSHRCTKKHLAGLRIRESIWFAFLSWFSKDDIQVFLVPFHNFDEVCDAVLLVSQYLNAAKGY